MDTISISLLAEYTYIMSSERRQISERVKTGYPKTNSDGIASHREKETRKPGITAAWTIVLSHHHHHHHRHHHHKLESTSNFHSGVMDVNERRSEREVEL